MRFCQTEKGLRLHCWCIMSNHLHLIVSAKENNLSDVLRDFKKFTSKQVVKAITENKQESRRDWMLAIFMKEGAKNSRNKGFQFWRHSLSRSRFGNNQPMELYSGAFTFQKMNYLPTGRQVSIKIRLKPE